MFKGINAIEFNKKFFNNESCYDYLLAKKWGKGFACSRCGHSEYKKGRTSYSRRCKHCGYEESVTANTIFHGMKMPLLKAFHMVFRLTAKKKGMSTVELGAEVGVQQKTAWLLKRKIQVVMKEGDKDKLTGNVDIDEMLVGGHSKGTRGRTLIQKSAVMVAVENLPDGYTGNLNFRVLDNFSALTMKYAIKEMVEPEAKLKSDCHQSYQSLSKELSNLKTVPFEEGNNYKQLHTQIMLFKNWLRGIHHKCSKLNLYAYLDEYKYRFNKRNMRRWLFNDTIGRMMHYPPHPYPVLKTLDAYST
jgi:ISXO2-like transposase domain/Transposase zinc-ribbon domain